MKACVMLTCFNRKDKTINCIKSLVAGNKAELDFIVVDDGSSDGTVEALENLKSEASIEIIRGDGNLYYSGGMRKAMEASKCQANSPDIYILANDDAIFDEGIVDELESILDSTTSHGGVRNADTVLVGAMRDSNGNCSYGGIRYTNGIHYITVKPGDTDRSCDTFNANFVAIPAAIYEQDPVMDAVYRHSHGDLDYGLQIKRAGYNIKVTDHFVGVCDNNPSMGTWRDTSLSRRERIKRKENVKGAPARQWFHFLNKNFGISKAILYSVTPYIRILLGK